MNEKSSTSVIMMYQLVQWKNFCKNSFSILDTHGAFEVLTELLFYLLQKF